MRYTLPYAVFTGQQRIRALKVIAQTVTEAQPRRCGLGPCATTWGYSSGSANAIGYGGAWG